MSLLNCLAGAIPGRERVITEEVFELQNRELLRTFNSAWPLLEAADLVGDLWSVPAYLRKCVPWLSADDIRKLQRAVAQTWTVSDLPLLDAARQRLGDPEASRRTRQHDAGVAAERERMATVIDNLIEADDDGEGLVTSLRQQDLQDALVDETALPSTDPDLLAPARSRTSSWTKPRSSRMPSGSCCCCGARPAASPSWATGLGPGTGSRSPGRSGSSGSAWTGSRSRP